MMEELKGIKLDRWDVPLIKCGDLLYYEGPLLSHFVDANNFEKNYFYRWVDNDEECHRWLVYQNTEEDLLKFFNGVLTERDLIERSGYVILLDLEDDLHRRAIHFCSFINIPSAYLPSNKSYFEESRYDPYVMDLRYLLEQRVGNK